MASVLSKPRSKVKSKPRSKLRTLILSRITSSSKTSNVPQLSVAEAKQQLRKNAANIDYLAPIKENPIQSVSISFVTGLLAGGEKSNSLATSKVTTLVAKSLIAI